MDTNRWAIGSLVAAGALAALVVACGGESKGGPTPIFRAEIVGPASIAPGSSATYTVTQYLRDGTSQAVAASSWASSNTALVRIDASGLATALAGTGEVVLSAATGGVNASKEVIVLPDGTYRIVGRVTDVRQPNTPIPGVQLEVTGGPLTTTAADGGYKLFGTPSDAEVRLTKDGYIASVQRLQLSAHGTHNFQLEFDGALRNFAGNYTVSIDGAPGCPNSGTRLLWEDLRSRSYLAVVKQTGSQLDVELSEPRFRPPGDGFAGNRFAGFVTPTGARFEITSDYYGLFADVMEALPDGSRLSISGTATTSGSPSGLVGAMSGWMAQISDSFNFLGGCVTSTFRLTPR